MISNGVFFATAVDPQSVIDDASTLFAADRPEHNLLLGVLQIAASGARTPAAFCGAVREGEQLVGFAVRTPPMPLLLSEMPLDAAFTLLPLLVGMVHVEGALMINGPASLTDALSLRLVEAYGLTRSPGQRMRLFALRRVEPVPRPAGLMRVAHAADADLVLRYFEEFIDEATPHERGLRRLERQVEDGIVQARIFLWEHEGQAVALAQRGRDTGKGASIGPVYTPQPLRGQGYATALVADLSQLILDEGKVHTCLFTDLANPISNRIYPRIGYREVCDFAQWQLSQA